MELLFLLALAYALLPIVAFAIAWRTNGRLKKLEGEFASLRGMGGAQPEEQASRVQDDAISESPPEPASDEDEPELSAEPDAVADEETDSPDEAQPQPDQPQPKRKLDLENLIGGRWSTLLGGLTLALGIIFLVRHTIEAGLLGPGARVVLGFAFSGTLFAAGEYLRRKDLQLNLPAYEKADVPGILTGAGSIGAFATLYASYALYGFIGPGIAFIGLTLIGLASLALSAIHGPKLAALGLLGSYASPLLVSTNEPNPIALALHIIAVTASVMVTARLRNWRWLALSGAVASSAWVCLAATVTTPTSGIAGIMMLVALAAIFTITFGWRGDLFAEPEDEPTSKTAIIAFVLFSLAYTVQMVGNSHLPETPTALALSLIIIGGAALLPGLGGISMSACFIALFAILASRLELNVIDGLTTTDDLKNYLVPPDTNAFVMNAVLLALPPALLAIWGARRAALSAPSRTGWLASATSTLAFFALVITYLRIAPFETRPLIGAISLAVSFGLVALTEYFIRLDPENNKAPAPAAFAVGAVSTISFAIAVSFSKGWMPLAFSIASLGIVLIYLKRPVSVLPWLALAAAIPGCVALVFNMPLAMPVISSTYILNGLITLLGIPAIALLAAGELLRNTGSRVASPAITALGLGVAALFVGLELVHLINGGDLASARQSLAETAAHSLAGMGFAYGLQRVATRTEASIYHYASYVVGIASVAAMSFGLLLAYNPYFDGKSVGGGTLFNLLLPGYLLTGLAAGAVALASLSVKPRWYTLMYAGLSGALLFAYASLMLRKSFQGDVLTFWKQTSDLEFWLYSPLWLGLGALILAIGLKFKSTPIRAASGLLIALTIVKVFLLDMSALTGALRAFSFIGLGLSLIVIGRYYQRILLKAGTSGEDASNR